MGLHQSGEMYLETILILMQENGHVRALDIAEHMGYSKPSVSRAVKRLKESGHITVNEEGLVCLTELGVRVASKIYERHTLIKDLLVQLGVDPETAGEDACKIEHDISDKSFDAIKNHVLINRLPNS